MRIDLFNSAASQLSNELSSHQVGTPASASASAKSADVSNDDRTTLTSDTTSLASLVSTALSSP